MEVAGLPGSGKTTLCAQIAAEVQSKGGIVVSVDTEERIDEKYWTALGVDLNSVLRIEANELEEVFDKQAKLIEVVKKKAPDRPVLMLWDSVGGTGVSGIKTMEEAQKAMMKKARVIGAGMELINSQIAKSRVCYLYTNQLYTKPGVMFGDPLETPGGNKLKHFATVRLRLTEGAALKEKDEKLGMERIVGKKVYVKALKNSMAPMLLNLAGVIYGGKGFDNDRTVKNVAEAVGLITKSGAWSRWITPNGEEVKFQGWSGFQDKVMSHPNYQDLYDEVVNKL